MLRKAVLITPSNIEALAQRFDANEDGTREPLAVGWALVAPFNSEDAEYDLLAPNKLRELYSFTGRRLENDFLEVRRRETPETV